MTTRGGVGRETAQGRIHGVTVLHRTPATKRDLHPAGSSPGSQKKKNATAPLGPGHRRHQVPTPSVFLILARAWLGVPGLFAVTFPLDALCSARQDHQRAARQ
jgi:hypothetical protein